MDFFHIWILPLLIFFARIGDVTIGTLRLIFLSRDRTVLAPALGFVEVIIWLLAVGQVVQNLTEPALYIAYASGYAMGTFIGMKIEGKLALGWVFIRVMTKRDPSAMTNHLIENNWRITHIDASGLQGNVHIIFMVIRRKNINKMVKVVNEFHPEAFYSVEDVRQVREGMEPPGFMPAVLDPVQRK